MEGVEVEKLDSEAVAVFVGQAQVDELDVEAVVELVEGTEIDERDRDRTCSRSRSRRNRGQ